MMLCISNYKLEILQIQFTNTQMRVSWMTVELIAIKVAVVDKLYQPFWTTFHGSAMDQLTCTLFFIL